MPVAVSVPSEPTMPRLSISVKICVAGIVRDRVVGAVARVDGRIASVAAAQRVVAGAARQDVVAAMSPQRVVAAEAGERVGLVAAGQRLAGVRADAGDGSVWHAAVDDVARAGARAIRIGQGSSDDQIGKAVGVDVASRINGIAALVRRGDAVDLEAVAAVESREIDVGGEARSGAEHHIGRSGDVAVRIGTAPLR